MASYSLLEEVWGVGLGAVDDRRLPYASVTPNAATTADIPQQNFQDADPIPIRRPSQPQQPPEARLPVVAPTPSATIDTRINDLERQVMWLHDSVESLLADRKASASKSVNQADILLYVAAGALLVFMFDPFVRRHTGR